MRPLGWAPTQSERCPYKRRLGHRDAEGARALRGDHVKRWPDSGSPQAKERGLGGNRTADTLTWDFQSPDCEKINWFKPLGGWHFVMVA